MIEELRERAGTASRRRILGRGLALGAAGVVATRR
jgi:hypothetical protein